ncbi:MAG: copper resistance protein CopC [Gemmatimonadota bacterium]|nr:copper resistance protein CopC [Gemmatimonadota bacterium]
MNKRLAALALISVVATGVLMGSATNIDTSHFGLAKSVPESDSSLSSLGAIQLWFTQVPQDNSVGIRLINSAGDLMETDPPMQDSEDLKSYSIQVKGELGSGTYTVAWRGIGDDGHVVRSEFSFAIDAH